MVRVPGLGPGGRRFESFHPDHFLYTLYLTLLMVGLAQLVRALVCGAGGRGFEPRIPPHTIIINIKTFFNNWKRPWLNWIEFRISAPRVIGSNPIGRTIILYASRLGTEALIFSKSRNRQYK